MEAIIAPIILFVLSLIGAYVLFKMLKSTAVLNEKKKQITGALVGFIIIYGLLFSVSYKLRGSVPDKVHTELKKKYEDKMAEIIATWKPQEWTVEGNINKEESQSYLGIQVQYQPPSPALVIDKEDGHFVLYRVSIVQGIGWPRLKFFCQGYNPDSYYIDSRIDIVNEAERIIRLGNPVELIKNQ